MMVLACAESVQLNWFDLFDDKEEAPLMTCLVVNFNVIKCVHVCVSVEVCVYIQTEVRMGCLWTIYFKDHCGHGGLCVAFL